MGTHALISARERELESACADALWQLDHDYAIGAQAILRGIAHVHPGVLIPMVRQSSD
jgi:hypothetical protein